MKLEEARTHSWTSDPFDRVLPQHVRESLVGRPQVTPKVPQVAAKVPQVTPKRPQEREAKNVVLSVVAAVAAVAAVVALLGVITLAGHFRSNSTAQALPTPIPRLPTPSPAPTAVATIDPPRAELIRMPAPRAKLLALPHWRVGQSQLVRMPDGLQVLATLKGSVLSAYQLPETGNHIGDTYIVGDNSEWVWLTPAGSTQAAWIDP